MSSQNSPSEYSFSRMGRTNNSADPETSLKIRDLLIKTYGVTYFKAFANSHPYPRLPAQPLFKAKVHQERPKLIRKLNFEYRKTATPEEDEEQAFSNIFGLSPQTNQRSNRDYVGAFRCIYGVYKPNKKKKSFSDDGFVLIENKTVKTFKEHGQLFRTTPIAETNLVNYEEGEQFAFGGFEYELTERLMAEDIQNKNFANARSYKR